MVPRYIDARLAEKAMKKLEQEDIAAYGDDCESVFDSTAAIYALQDVPTADVAPVVHAHWEKIDNDCGHYGFVKCTACGDEYGSLTYRYCPNCGAKMDEKENKQ